MMSLHFCFVLTFPSGIKRIDLYLYMMINCIEISPFLKKLEIFAYWTHGIEKLIGRILELPRKQVLGRPVEDCLDC